MMDLGDIRQEYVQGHLDENKVAAEPMDQFHAWFDAYRQSEPLEPTVMTLASVDDQQLPWQRIVLLKSYDRAGIVFFTNYDSNKGRQLIAHGKASAHFSWLEQERQVLLQGTVEKIPRADSEAYFQRRPRESQLGAWASKQSSPLANRAELEQAFQDMEQKFQGQPIPLPEYWGGFLLKPERAEFWQGGAHRLHDRVEYVFDGKNWQKTRLAP